MQGVLGDGDQAQVRLKSTVLVVVPWTSIVRPASVDIV